VRRGAGSLVIGVANFGGVIPERWFPSLHAAVTAGLDIVSGAYKRLEDVPCLADAAATNGVSLHAAGIDYAAESPQLILDQIEPVANRVHDNTTRQDLMETLPAGGARNALDCALWDVEAKRSGAPAWHNAGLVSNTSVISAFTIGIGSAAETREKDRELRNWPLIKVEIDGNDPMAAIKIVAEEAPSASLIVDANQAWPIDQPNTFAQDLAERKLALIEQPLKVGTDEALRGFCGPVPLAANETCVDRLSRPRPKRLYDVINSSKRAGRLRRFSCQLRPGQRVSRSWSGVRRGRRSQWPLRSSSHKQLSLWIWMDRLSTAMIVQTG
jgi:hypothetical protein